MMCVYVYHAVSGFRKCKGPELQCGIVNKRPIMAADFRNKTRFLVAQHGVVAADSSRCSQIGRDVLQGGGNAVDAAVATSFCLGVVNPISSGIGGGSFILVRMADGTSEFINGRETAPAAATANMYDGESAALLALATYIGVTVIIMAIGWQWPAACPYQGSAAMQGYR